MGLLLGTVVLWVVLGAQSWLWGVPLRNALWEGVLWGSVAAGLHAVTFVMLLNPSINALCHWPHKWLGGYQNSSAAHAFRTFNNWIVAFLTAGEGFHNNHHDQQATARFAWTRTELIADWGYWAVIVPLRWLGLATQVRLPKVGSASSQAA
jgi:stearoyl-CoA desaturase (delta-9 desaturase)